MYLAHNTPHWNMSRIDFLKLWKQAKDVDPDIRFMALSDIDKILTVERDMLMDNAGRLKEIEKLLVVLLQDINSEVQNQAVKDYKTFAAILGDNDVKVATLIVKDLFGLVVNYKLSKKQQTEALIMTSSVYTLALRYFIQNLKYTVKLGPYLSTNIISIIFPVIANSDSGIVEFLDYAEILYDVIKFSGKYFTDSQVQKLITLLTESSYKAYGVLSSKAIASLGLLSTLIEDRSQIDELIKYSVLDGSDINSRYSELESSKLESVKLNILFSISRVKPDKFQKQFDLVFALVKRDLFLSDINDLEMDSDERFTMDEIRDIAFSCIENLLQLGYNKISSHVDDLLEIAKLFLKYDPYTIDYEDEDDDINEMDIDNEEEDDEILFSDDEENEDFEEEDNDDISWRLRKQSARVIGLLVNKGKYSILPKLFLEKEKIFELLVTKLDDTNDLALHENFQTLCLITEQVRKQKDSSNDIFKKFIEKLDFLTNNICKCLVNCKNVGILNDNFRFITDLIHVSGSYFRTEHLSLVLDAICEYKKSSKANNFIIDNEIINLYIAIFNSANFLGVKQYIPSIANDLLSGIKDDVHSTVILSFIAVIELAKNLISKRVSLNEFSEMSDLLKFSIDLAGSQKTYNSVKEKANEFCIIVFASSQITDKSASDAILENIKNNLRYDSLTESTLQHIKTIFSLKGRTIDNSWLDAIIVQLLDFIQGKSLQMNHTIVVDESVNILLIILDNESLHRQLSQNIFINILETMFLKFHDKDVKLRQNKLLAIGKLLSNLNHVNISLVEQVIELIFDSLARLFSSENSYPISSVAKALAQKVDAEKLFEEVFQEAKYIENPATADVLSIIAVLGNLMKKVSGYERLLITSTYDEKHLIFIINFLGGVAKHRSLDIDIDVFVDLLKKYQDNDNIKFCIAKNIGRIISIDIDGYLPYILNYLNTLRDKEDSESKVLRYAFLLALKQEMDIHYNKVTYGSDKIYIKKKDALRIWDCIFSIKIEEVNDSNLDELSVSSEILTYIVFFDHSFMERLDDYLSKSQESWRDASNYLIGSIVRYLNILEFFKSETYEGFLTKPSFLNFLKYNLKTESIPLRQVTLDLFVNILGSNIELFFNSGLLNNDVIPILLEELKPTTGFIKKIQIGPYKHKIDEGVELRKTVYQLLISLSSNNLFVQQCDEKVWSSIVETIVKFGLKDTSDIILLTNMIFKSILTISPDVLFDNLESLDVFCTKSLKIIKRKSGDKATKQQIEERLENKNSTLSAIETLDAIFKKNNKNYSAEVVARWKLFISEGSV